MFISNSGHNKENIPPINQIATQPQAQAPVVNNVAVATFSNSASENSSPKTSPRNSPPKYTLHRKGELIEKRPVELSEEEKLQQKYDTYCTLYTLFDGIFKDHLKTPMEQKKPLGDKFTTAFRNIRETRNELWRELYSSGSNKC